MSAEISAHKELEKTLFVLKVQFEEVIYNIPIQ
mgnify:CR=1 FL=1